MFKYFFKSKFKSFSPILLIPFAAIIIIIFNVNRSYDRFVYWDEAETILHAKMILKNGYPKQTDPDTYHSFARGAEFGPGGSEIYHTWSYMYFSAAVLKIQEFIGGRQNYNFLRLLFLLIGLASAIPMFLILNKININIKLNVALLSIVLSNEYLFIYLFNLKYFSFSILFSALFIFMYLKYRETGRYWLFIMAALLLYHTQWTHAAVVFFIFCIWDSIRIFFYEKNPIVFKIKQMKPWIILFCLTLAHAVYFMPINKLKYVNSWLDRLISSIASRDVFFDINSVFIAVPIFIVLTLIYLKNIKLRLTKIEYEIFILVNLVFISVLVFSTQTVTVLKIRHLVILVPFYLIMVAIILQFLYVKNINNKTGANIFFYVLAFVFLAGEWAYLSKYIDNDIRKSDEIKSAIVWIQKNIKQGSSIYANLNRETLLIHTKLKLVNAADLFTESNVRVINPILPEQDPTYLPIEKTQWIFWNKIRDRSARVLKTWANPEYISLLEIPVYFKPVFEGPTYVVYKNIKFIN